MKTAVNSFLVLFFSLVILVATACKDNTSLEVSTSSLTVSADSGSSTFKIICDGEWKITSNDAWCTVTASGSDTQDVEIKADAYNGVNNRQTTLTIINGNETKTITVTQLGVGLSLEFQTLNFPAEGGSRTLSLLTESYSWIIDPMTNATFTVDPMNGVGNGKLKITVPENTTENTKTQVVTVNYNNQKRQFTILQAKRLKKEDIHTVLVVASCDTTFSKENEQMGATINWKSPFSNEAALVKISVSAQKDLLLKAKTNNNGVDVVLYISAVQVWVAATAQYAAIVYKGDQKNFAEASRGEDIVQYVVGTKWKKLNLDLSYPCEMAGVEDIFIGAYASNASAASFPFVTLSNNPKFPGVAAQYPSYGVCPDVEKYIQELNDPKDTRWNTWVKNTNWAMALVISTETAHK